MMYDDEEFYPEDIQALIEKYENASASHQIEIIDEENIEFMLDFYEAHEQMQKALTLVNTALEWYPFSASLMSRKAEMLIEQEQYTEAKELIDTALAIEPAELSFHLVHSDIYVAQGQYSIAIDILKEALTIVDEDDKADLHLEIADVYEEWEKYELTFKHLKLTLNINPLHEEALDRIWFLVEMTGKYEESIAYHNQLINKSPYNHLAWYNLANAYLGLEQYENAINAFEYVVAINPKYDYAHSELGDIYMKLGRYDKAINSYEEAIEADRPTEELYYQIGMCYLQKKEYAKARNYFKKATRLEVMYDEAYYRIGQTYMGQFNVERAISFYTRAINLAPNTTIYHIELAFAYYHAEQYEKAIEVSSSCIEMTTEELEPYLLIACCLMHLQMKNELFEWLDLMLEKLEFIEVIIMKAVFCFIYNEDQEARNLLITPMETPEIHWDFIFDYLPMAKTEEELMQYIHQYKLKFGNNN